MAARAKQEREAAAAAEARAKKERKAAAAAEARAKKEQEAAAAARVKQEREAAAAAQAKQERDAATKPAHRAVRRATVTIAVGPNRRRSVHRLRCTRPSSLRSRARIASSSADRRRVAVDSQDRRRRARRRQPSSGTRIRSRSSPRRQRNCRRRCSPPPVAGSCCCSRSSTTRSRVDRRPTRTRRPPAPITKHRPLDTGADDDSAARTASGCAASTGRRSSGAGRRRRPNSNSWRSAARARQQFGRGDWQNGVATANEGFELRKDDPELQKMVSEALASARSQMTIQRDLATAVGRHAIGTEAFQAGMRRQRSVDQLQRSGQTTGAVRAAREAEDLFRQAYAEGRELAQNDANATKPPVVATPPPPNPGAGRSTAPPTPSSTQATPAQQPTPIPRRRRRPAPRSA